MPTTFPKLKLALTNHLIDNWTETPICEKGAGGLDLTGQVQDSLFSLQHDFIEISVSVTRRASAGVSRHGGTKVLAHLDVQMYTQPGNGTMRLATLQAALYPLLERKSISSAEVRSASGHSRPYEFRGHLTQIVSFPIEYFETT